jgi:hypothetical protein
MRALSACALLFVLASCSTPLALRLERNGVGPDGLPLQPPNRTLYVQRANFPQLSTMGVGSEMVIPTDEIGMYVAPDPRVLVLRFSTEPLPPVARVSWFGEFDVRRAQFVPALSPRFERVLDKE